MTEQIKKQYILEVVDPDHAEECPLGPFIYIEHGKHQLGFHGIRSAQNIHTYDCYGNPTVFGRMPVYRVKLKEEE